MTVPIFTREQLAAMPDRELDAAVGLVVFGWSQTPEKPPIYCNSWLGAGCIVERMQELGYAIEASSFCGFAEGAISFSKNHCYEWVHGSDLPRAAAIAAVLAVQGAA